MTATAIAPVQSSASVTEERDIGEPIENRWQSKMSVTAKDAAYRTLERVYAEASSAVAPITAVLAYRFLESLPVTFPPPEIEAEPDGRIAFDWFPDDGGMLTVSVGRRNVLAYSARIGPKTSYGTEVFLGGVPGEIMELLQWLYSPLAISAF